MGIDAFERMMKRARSGSPAHDGDAGKRARAHSSSETPVHQGLGSPVAQRDDDDAAQIVGYVTERASFGKRGRISTAGPRRRVLLIGRPYYWDQTPIPMDELPECFRRFATTHGLSDFNSILCNVYDEPSSKISAHCDNTSLLTPGAGGVVSVSFAKYSSDRDKHLADMVFLRNDQREVIPLYHGSQIRFNAYDDAREGRTHEVPKTHFARVNLTYRKLR